MSVHNEDIAAIFDELGDLLEVDNANPFRVRAYHNAARTVRGLGNEVSEMVDEGEDLTQLPGVGKDLAEKIQEILKTGHLNALDTLHKEIPASVDELLKIPGLGPRRVRVLFKTLNVKTLKQLEHAAKHGQIRDLPGFGVKTEQHILDSIAARRSSEKRYLYSVARQYAEPLAAYLKDIKGVNKVVVAGSYRRGQETVGDLDILVTASARSKVMEKFVDYEEVAEVTAKGKTRSSVILENGLQVDIRVVEPQSFGAALYYFTGSKAHNIEVRRLAQQKNLKINEYGVFRNDKRIAGDTEESVFKTVGLDFIPPELREARGEVDAGLNHYLPELITRDDLQGDLHVHTLASDGHASIEDMVRAAKDLGLKYIAITDHSHGLGVARGLDPERLQQQIDEIDRLNETLKGFTILKGSEVDILEDGKLDLPDSILSKLDLVIGSVHRMFNLSRTKQTSRILRAMDARYFTILAHPSGRLLMERDAYEVDMTRVIEGARQRGCFIELNSQPQRLDLTDNYCQMAKNEGVLISIDSDSHGPGNFENLKLGINQARRGWLEKDDVLNTRSLTKLRKLLKSTMG